jgi:hypothetical protein
MIKIKIIITEAEIKIILLTKTNFKEEKITLIIVSRTIKIIIIIIITEAATFLKTETIRNLTTVEVTLLKVLINNLICISSQINKQINN